MMDTIQRIAVALLVGSAIVVAAALVYGAATTGAEAIRIAWVLLAVAAALVAGAAVALLIRRLRR